MDFDFDAIAGGLSSTHKANRLCRVMLPKKWDRKLELCAFRLHHVIRSVRRRRRGYSGQNPFVLINAFQRDKAVGAVHFGVEFLAMSDIEFVGHAVNGPCEGKVLRASTHEVRVPVLEGYSEADEYGHRHPIFGAAIYRWMGESGGWWIVSTITRH